jgi:selenocysteine-specific elongation factor
VRDFATEFGMDERELRRVLRLTQKLGRTDQIAQDHFFAREITREMALILREVAAATPDGWFAAPAFRDRLSNGRKVAIQILDFFDRLGFTLRRGDLRRLNPHRIDLFDA